MLNYVDRYGQHHAKPVNSLGDPSSNDGLIISAYAKKLGMLDSVVPIEKMYLSLKRINLIPIERLPGKKTPFCSRDFFLGANFLGLISYIRMKHSDWKFSPMPLPKLNIFKLIHQLWNLRGKHRNTFWEQDGYEQVYHTAFMVPLQDRAFYYRSWKLSVPFEYRLIELIDKYFFYSNDDSSKLIRYLKYDQMPEIEVWSRYFGPKHPFTVKVRSMM